MTAIEWEKTYNWLSEEARDSKDSLVLPVGMLEAYDELSGSEKQTINAMLYEWFASNESGRRYIAALITRARSITSNRTAVANAIQRCEALSGPQPFYEAKKLRSLLAQLDKES